MASTSVFPLQLPFTLVGACLDHPQGLRVLEKFLRIGVLISSPSLSLWAEKLFKGILRDPVTEQWWCSW